MDIPTNVGPTEVLILGLYFLPGIVAAFRKHRNQNAIFILNALLGWTGLGWVVALVWAATNPPVRD